MAPIHVVNKVCITPIHVRSKFADWEGSHADFTPHIEQKHSFRNHKTAKIATSANFKQICLKPLTKEDFISYLTTFQNQNILRASTFKVCTLSLLL